MKVIGITGGVGAGKSRILDILKDEYNAEIVQTDLVARKLMEKGNSGYNALVKALQRDFLDEDGQIDRVKLAAILFQEPDVKKMVDALIHPMVWEAVEERKKTCTAPLLVVESAIMDQEKDDIFDEIWYVYTSEANRIKRLAENRAYSAKRSRAMIASQPTEEEFKRISQQVIDNNGSVEDVRSRLRFLMEGRGQEQ